MKEVREYLNIILEKNTSVVVACSGGPDSMCLLNLVLEQREEKNLNIICAHVNHKMRIESEKEAEFVKEYCEKNKIIFEYMEITEYTEDNFHNQARIKRYDFFKEVLEKYQSKILLTAHHGDDLVETILMRIVRGSNLKGYLGFKKESKFLNYHIYRPLISITKNEIEKYNHDNNIPYVLDQSNEKDKYTRNRYRHQILPFLKNEDKEVHKKFLKFSEELINLENFLEKYMSNVLTEIIKDDTLDISLFQKQDEFVQQKIIEAMIAKIQENELFFMEDKHVLLIINLINNDKANSYIELPNNFIAVKNYNNFKIIKQSSSNKYNMELKDINSLPNGKIIKKISTSNETSNYVIRLNSEELYLPLYIRTRLDGDKIATKHLVGRKKIKDIFIDSKIPSSKRDEWPIVVDSKDNILWLPGLKKSKFDKEITDKYDIILKYEEENNEEK